MLYRDFKGKKLSLLGYGAMRLPTLGSDDKIDVSEAERLIDRAMEAGVNYYDTAYPYHGGNSEIAVGKILKKYPRDSYYIATKFPGHQVMSEYNPADVFERQLRKCGVDYFDFYLLHNVNESSIDTYLDEKWGIIDYFLEQKKQGKIKHLGFSTHGAVENIREFLDKTGDAMEFCQIQQNYLDDSLQRAGEKYKLLTERGIPVFVMEPVRGGKLVGGLPDTAKENLKSMRPEESIAAWGFRWLMDYENIAVILSGMSNMEQLEDNIKTFSEDKPLSDDERRALSDIAESLKKSVPCTGCRYCTDLCPMGLNIPLMMEVYNDIRYSPGVNSALKIEFLPDDKKPESCLACGACSSICPQKIDIPAAIAALSESLKTIPSWRKISLDREEAARKIAENEEK